MLEPHRRHRICGGLRCLTSRGFRLDVGVDVGLGVGGLRIDRAVGRRGEDSDRAAVRALRELDPCTRPLRQRHTLFGLVDRR